VTPPAAIESLRLAKNTSDEVTLTWTAPGDDGSNGQAAIYDLRFADRVIVEAGWDSATIVPSPPTPKRAGQPESFSMEALAPGLRYFALKTADESQNWSELSNVIAATVLGDSPPAAIGDLEIVTETRSSVSLRWTATGRDGSIGTASAYDLRHSLEAITDENWGSASRVDSVPQPQSAGAEESFTVTGLEPGLTYFFAIRAIDDTPLESTLSNVVSTTTRTRLRLTTSSRPPGAGYPHWSPDGTEILFSADWAADRRPQIYLIGSDGEGLSRLTNLEEGAEHPKWSSDGKRLAFISRRPDGAFTSRELSVMEPRVGAAPVVIASHGRPTAVTALAWSPDGTKIAYALRLTEFGQVPIRCEMYVVSSTGGTPTLLLEAGWNLWVMDWSPDGSTIAYTSRESGNYDIWTMPSSGGARTQVTTDPADNFGPAWSPDGTRIAFSSRRAGAFDLWMISAVGGEPTQLTFDIGSEAVPAWSPDGQQLVYAASEANIGDIWIMPLE